MKENLRKHFDLKEDQAGIEEIRERIASGSKVTGTNMFILVFAILIACIGLNTDSTAVVIGAMLISPLMGVIISLAYGIANNDTAWIKKSIAAFLFQIGISILTSTIYFTLSPINVFSGELAARTHPTLLDVLIAIFGGSAAIIANTRKNLVSNVIPGTAIATALMPPLCTVGYCIATHKWSEVLGSAYLFLINSIFICLSALLGLHIMNITRNKDLLHSKKSRFLLFILLLAAIIPSCFLAWETVTESRMEKNFRMFLNREFQFEHTYVVTSELNSQEKQIIISLIGSVINNSQIQSIEEKMANYKLEDYSLKIMQTHLDSGITKEELDLILEKNDKTDLTSNVDSELKETQMLLKLQQTEDALAAEILEEMQILYPKIASCGFTDLYNKEDKSTRPALLLILREPLKDEELQSIQKWIAYKMKQNIQILTIE